MKMQEILNLTDLAKCCGCGACAAVCPVNAITMAAKDLGAAYPEVNAELCISCGKCQKVCVFQGELERNDGPIAVYAAASTDADLLGRSASGGVFASLAKGVIAAGGVVYGCSMEQTQSGLTPMHIGVRTEADLVKLQGSKYVQSKTYQCFSEIKTYLKSNTPVFYSGTPCQVSALKRFLKGTDTDKLFTADVVCHGTPGNALFEAYLAWLEKEEKRPITEYLFRDKSRGWGLLAKYRSSAKNKHWETWLKPECSSYYKLFLESETYRESCYQCPWANTTRVADITLGDYWGIENEHPEYLAENGGKLSVSKGISVLLVNSARGEDMVRKFGKDLVLENSDLEYAVKWNKQLTGPSTHTALREELLSVYKKEGYIGIEKLFRKKQGLHYYVRKAKNLLLNWKIKRNYEQ